jgi:N-acetylglutamate synthase-like GNAT family acetyltransferase
VKRRLPDDLLKIRKASTEDHPQLTRLAHDAKRHWGYPDHWIKHWEDALTITPEYIETNQVFVAEDGANIVGFYALIVAQDHADLDHMWVSPEHMGSGVGKALFIHAMRGAKGQNISEVEILSDPHAEDFYKKMGAYRTGESVSEVDGQRRVLPRLTIDPASS